MGSRRQGASYSLRATATGGQQRGVLAGRQACPNGFGGHYGKLWDRGRGKELVTLAGHSGLGLERGVLAGREAHANGL